MDKIQILIRSETRISFVLSLFFSDGFFPSLLIPFLSHPAFRQAAQPAPTTWTDQWVIREVCQINHSLP